MGAPEYVPLKPATKVRTYGSPPRREGSWRADRPGELSGRQPDGERLGTPGPDAGYALTLAARFRDSLQLHEGESAADVLAGAAAVAMKRAGLFGRAPIGPDVEIGLVVWGYLDANVADELVDIRRSWFAEIHSTHHYMERRRVADAVSEDRLRGTAAAIKTAYEDDWRACLDLDV